MVRPESKGGTRSEFRPAGDREPGKDGARSLPVGARRHNNGERESNMVRTNSAIAKAERFGVPSLELCTNIDNEDMVCRLRAAHFKLASRMRSLELQFEEKASELRQAFLTESSEILNGFEEDE
jgi:hypothetical protein